MAVGSRTRRVFIKASSGSWVLTRREGSQRIKEKWDHVTGIYVSRTIYHAEAYEQVREHDVLQICLVDGDDEQLLEIFYPSTLARVFAKYCPNLEPGMEVRFTVWPVTNNPQATTGKIEFADGKGDWKDLECLPYEEGTTIPNKDLVADRMIRTGPSYLDSVPDSEAAPGETDPSEPSEPGEGGKPLMNDVMGWAFPVADRPGPDTFKTAAAPKVLQGIEDLMAAKVADRNLHPMVIEVILRELGRPGLNASGYISQGDGLLVGRTLKNAPDRTIGKVISYARAKADRDCEI